MEKLTDFIQKFRVSPETKKTLIDISQIKKRKLTEFIRIQLECIVEEFEKDNTKMGCG